MANPEWVDAILGTTKERKPSKPSVPKGAQTLRRGVLYTPQHFTPEEGGVSSRP